MFIQFAPVVLGLHVLVAAAGGTPAVDIQKSCHESQNAVVAVLGSDTAVTYDNCLSQEKGAREQIVKDWSGYPAVDKRMCVQPASYMPSYVEWLTCLEMRREVKRSRDEAAAAKAHAPR